MGGGGKFGLRNIKVGESYKKLAMENNEIIIYFLILSIYSFHGKGIGIGGGKVGSLGSF